MSNTCVSRCIKMWTVMILAVILAFGVSPTAATLPTCEYFFLSAVSGEDRVRFHLSHQNFYDSPPRLT